MDTDDGPVFHYRRPEGVTYTTSYGVTDLHMHMIGNRTLNAFVRPEGDVDILIRDPGFLWLTRDPQRRTHLTDGAAVTLPDGSRIAIPSAANGTTYASEAEFGLGFVRFAPTYFKVDDAEIEVQRKLEVPHLDIQDIFASTTFVNHSDQTVTFQFDERWIASQIPMLPGLTSESSFDDRAEFRDKTEFMQWVSGSTVWVKPTGSAAPKSAPADLSYYPPLRLAAQSPDGAAIGTSGAIQLPAPMTLQWNLTLAPGESRVIEASFGTGIQSFGRVGCSNAVSVPWPGK